MRCVTPPCFALLRSQLILLEPLQRNAALDNLNQKPMLRVRLASLTSIAEYASVSCAFRVRSQLDVDRLETDGLFAGRLVMPPFVKDYDAIFQNAPMDWSHQFDTSTWHMFSAFNAETRVGGAIIIPRAKDDLVRAAELWDFRVGPSARGRGVGRALFEAVIQWCREHDHDSLLIETQHNNVGACCFYRANGCVVQSITRYAYPSIPDETRIRWRRDC